MLQRLSFNKYAPLMFGFYFYGLMGFVDVFGLDFLHGFSLGFSERFLVVILWCLVHSSIELLLVPEVNRRHVQYEYTFHGINR